MKIRKIGKLLFILFFLFLPPSVSLSEEIEHRQHIISYDSRGTTKENINEVLRNVSEGDEFVVRFYPSSVFHPEDPREHKEVIKKITGPEAQLKLLYPRITETQQEEVTLYPVRPEKFYALFNKEQPVKLDVYEQKNETSTLVDSIVGNMLLKIKNVSLIEFDVAKLRKMSFDENMSYTLEVFPEYKSELKDKVKIRFKENIKSMNLVYRKDEGMWKSVPFEMPPESGFPYLESRLSNLSGATKYQYYISYTMKPPELGKEIEISLTDPQTFYVMRSPSSLRFRVGAIAIGDGRTTTTAVLFLIYLKKRSIDMELPILPFPFRKNFVHFLYRFNPTVGLDKEARILYGMSVELNSVADAVVGGRFGGDQVEPFGVKKNLYYGITVDISILKSLKDLLGTF